MSKRASDIMALLKSALKLELPSFIMTEGSSSGDPTLQIAADSSPASQKEVAFLKIVQKSYTGFPTPSLASAEDGRTHLIQLAVENLTAHATISCWSSVNFSKLVARLKDANVEIELYIKAAAAIPVEADITAANLVGSIRADVRHANAGN